MQKQQEELYMSKYAGRYKEINIIKRDQVYQHDSLSSYNVQMSPQRLQWISCCVNKNCKQILSIGEVVKYFLT